MGKSTDGKPITPWEGSWTQGVNNPFRNLMTLPVDYHSLSPSMKKTVREQYITNQKGRCQHCNAPLDGPPPDRYAKCFIDTRLFPDGFFNHPVHLHHNHETGKTIGAVHARCNAWLFQYRGE